MDGDGVGAEPGAEEEGEASTDRRDGASARTRRFEDLLARYLDQMKALVAARVPDPHWGADILQDACVDVLRALDRLDPRADPGPWIRTLVLNRIRKAYRDAGRRPFLLDALADWEDPRAIPPGDSGALGPGLGLGTERIEALRRCLERLPAADAALIRGRYHEGRAVRTIASEQGKTPNAISQRLARLRAALRACMEKGAAGATDDEKER